MECRLYHGGEGRTRLHSLTYTRLDLIAGIIVAAVCGGAIALSIVL